MGKKQKAARLEAAVANARAALASTEVARLESATSELRSAILDAYERGREIGAPELLRRMNARVEELVVSALERTLTACPCCKGTELLVSKRSGSVDLGAASLTVMLVVCRSCGDVRMRCEDVAAVAEDVVVADIKRFRTITLPSRDPAPFR
jgi:hypothetical protein